MKKHEVFKVLGDETRFDIVRFLAGSKERSCSDLSSKFPHLSQPTLSHHFKVLKEAKLITVTKRGTACIYSLNDEVLAGVGITVRK